MRINIVIIFLFSGFWILSSGEQQLYYKHGDTLIYRSFVPNEKKSWSIPWDDYKPVNFTLDFTSKSYGDPEIGDLKFHPKFNEIDGKVDRRGYEGPYKVINGYPLNPLGRSGISLRGRLGRWGPNKAADPIVTRWKRDNDGKVVYNSLSKLPILQFIAIERRDSGYWAIPGGMTDAGEDAITTAKREFLEEALNSLQLSKEKKELMEKSLEHFFSGGIEIYRGCVNDPRNTDNAWMETVAFNFHDEDGVMMEKMSFHAGDDAKNVKWTDIDKELKLYANHIDFIHKTAQRRAAHW